MPRGAPIQASYNAGELSPKLDGRIDIARRSAGLQFVENAIAEVQGGAARRPGSRFAAPVKDHAKATYLAPFVYATEAAYILEFGEGYVRFYRDHAPLLEAAKTISGATQANPVVLTINAHGYSNGQDFEVSGVGGMTQLNGRRFRAANVTANSVELNDQFGGTIDGTGYSAYASGGSARRVYTIATPYLEADLPAVKYVQSNDVLYLAHANYVPRKLIRLGALQWSLEQLDFIDGPYLPQNRSQATLAPSATSGAGITISSATSKAITNCANNGAGRIRVTSANHGWQTNDRVRIAGVTGTTEANGDWSVIRINASTYDLLGSSFVNAYVSGGTATPLIFAATDLGRLVRIKHGATWGYAKIVGFTSETSVTADVLSNFGAVTAQTAWRLGLYSQTYGYPNAVNIFEDRLALGGVPITPTRWDYSVSGDYENFAPTATDGTVGNDNAVSLAMNSGDANVIRWGKDDEKGHLSGTIGGEWLIRANTLGEALTPSNPKATRPATYGSADRQPVRAGKDVVYIMRGKRKLRNLSYVFEDDGFRAGDVTLLSEHMSRSGLEQLAFQSEPNSVIWATRGDGQLLSVTYSRDQEAIGWSRHLYGGVSDSRGRKFAECKSVACIPAHGGAQGELGFDEPWVIVRRHINGRSVQYVEWHPPAWEKGDDQHKAYYVDSGLQFDGAQAVTLQPGANAVTKGATSVPFDAGAALFVAGDVGRRIHYRWFDWSHRDKYGNRGRYRSAIARITQFNSATQVLAAIEAAFPDTDQIAAGAWRMTATVISGLWHLEGQSVQILADGAAHPDKVVAMGQVTLDRPASFASIGLGYVMDLLTLRLEAGAGEGTAQGKPKKIHDVTLRLYETLGAKYGPDFDHLSPLQFRTASDPMDQAPPIRSGDFKVLWEGGYDSEGRIALRQDQPFPFTLLALMPNVVTNDRG